MLKYDERGFVYDDGQPNNWADYPLPEPVSEPTAFDVAASRVKKSVKRDNVDLPIDDRDQALLTMRNKLFGANGEERYQLWPEKMVRSAVTLPGQVVSGEVPVVDPTTGRTSQELIERTQDLAGMAGGGSFALGKGAEASLGSAPFLRPALKYKEKIYKAPEGGQHLDALPKELQSIFEQQVMSGEDISNFNFGFINHKGQFLNREKALDYAIKEGLLDPQNAQYGALTSTLMSDSNIAAPLSALAKPNAMGFYSSLERAVGQAKINKATPEQWIGYLKNQPGVKQEEISHVLGELPKEPITKEAMQGIVEQNKVQLVEKVLGDKGEQWQLSYKDGSGTFQRYATKEEAEDAIKSLGAENRMEVKSFVDKTPTKYHSYQLPGASNYKETLLTLPNLKLEQAAQKLKEFESQFKSKPIPFDRQLEHKDLQQAIRDAKTPENNMFTSSHWDEPNVLAHVRTNDRTIKGQKALHIEEIQSDWHQKGRKEGYKDIEAENKANELSKYALTNLNNQLKKVGMSDRDIGSFKSQLEGLVGQKNGYLRGNPVELNKFLDRMENKYGIEVRQLADTYAGTHENVGRTNMINQTTVPNAPFKKSWDELALKRMIVKAAKEGYDAISWTPGEAQAARYDLSKQVEKLQATKNADGTYKLNARPINDAGFTELHGSVPENKLSDYVGKDLAKKIINDKIGIGGAKSYSGIDLKVGGEGMKAFYDKMLVDKANQIGKKYGVRVEQKEIPIKKELPFKGELTIDQNAKNGFWIYNNGKKTDIWFDNKEKALAYINNKDKQQPIHYLSLSPQLKQKALTEGFPLFSSSPILTPVAGDPWKQKETPIVDRSHDVPYLAGSSNDGKTVHIDRRVPETITVGNQTINPAVPLSIHEQTEHTLMTKNKMSYEDAHKIATAREKEWVLSRGLDWKSYESIMDGMLSHIEHENPKSPPNDLYLKPYPHDKQKLLQKNARKYKLTPVQHNPFE